MLLSEKNANVLLMNDFNRRGGGGFNNRGGNSAGRSSFGGGRRDGGGRDRGDRGDRNHRGDRQPQMFTATCASCHKTCEVPFRPSGDKPVYCSNCFTQKNEGGDRGFRGGDRGNDSRPRSGSNSFAVRKEHPNDRRQSGSDDEVKKRLATIESKLNRILEIINPPMPSEKEEKVSKKREAAPEKKVVDAPALKKAIKKATAKVAKKPTKKAAKKAAKKASK